MRSVKVYEEAWPLHTPFVISRGSRSEASVVVVEIEEEGVKGVGECTPYPRYGESLPSVMAQIMTLVPDLQKGLTRDALQQRLSAGAARNAIDCALWSLEAAKQQKSLTSMLGVVVPESVVTAQTVVIGEPEQMAASAKALYDAGATLADLGVAMLEQPLPAKEDAALKNFIHPLPVCADESCHTRENLSALKGSYDMVNIKLDKTGGLTEALALAADARAQGFALMLGCMLCTSRAIGAALPLVNQVRFADLDGPTWLAVDVSPALNFTSGVLHL